MILRKRLPLITGSRDGCDGLESVLDRELAREPFAMIIEGGATGVDSQAKYWAWSRGLHVAEVEALWSPSLPLAHRQRSPAAGPRRNWVMLLLQPTEVIAFPGGRGTADMIKAAGRAGVLVRQFLLDGTVRVNP